MEHVMREISSSIVVEIEHGETASLKVVQPTQLLVQCGAAWVSRSRDLADYFLFAGDTLRLRCGEQLWLSSEGGALARMQFSASPRRAAPGSLGARLFENLAGYFRGGWHLLRDPRGRPALAEHR
jgi:hypothetical protein